MRCTSTAKKQACSRSSESASFFRRRETDPMFRFILPVAAIGAFLALAQQSPAPIKTEVPAHGHAVIHILSANEDGEAVGEAVTSPLIAFRVENGHVYGAAVL